MRVKWEIVHDCDDENGNPTCWAKKFDGHTWWIILCNDGLYACETYVCGKFITHQYCKTLVSAKRWIAINCWKEC